MLVGVQYYYYCVLVNYCVQLLFECEIVWVGWLLFVWYGVYVCGCYVVVQVVMLGCVEIGELVEQIVCVWMVFECDYGFECIELFVGFLWIDVG